MTLETALAALLLTAWAGGYVAGRRCRTPASEVHHLHAVTVREDEDPVQALTDAAARAGVPQEQLDTLVAALPPEARR